MQGDLPELCGLCGVSGMLKAAAPPPSSPAGAPGAASDVIWELSAELGSSGCRPSASLAGGCSCRGMRSSSGSSICAPQLFYRVFTQSQACNVQASLREADCLTSSMQHKLQATAAGTRMLRKAARTRVPMAWIKAVVTKVNWKP